jgi:inner membrane protein
MENPKLKMKFQSITFKIVIIALLLLLFLIPQAMISSVIDDRQDYFLKAENDVQSSWGSDQIIAGPIITIPYFITEEEIYSEDNKMLKRKVEKRRVRAIVPKNQNVKSQLKHLIKERGIFDILLYKSKSEIIGNFSISEEVTEIKKLGRIDWDNINLNLGIKDNRGILNGSYLKTDLKESKQLFEPGLKDVNFNLDGIHSKLSFNEKNFDFNYEIQISLNGSNSFQVLPIGDETSLIIESDWKNPGFIGYKLPSNYKITETGFTGKWEIGKLSKKNKLRFTQEYNAYNNSRNSGIDHMNNYTESNAFGAQFLPEVNLYKLSDRSVKYAILFIFMTFIIYFGFEIFKLKSFHVIQYLFVGFSIALFFLILMALSEHINFLGAYILSSFMTIFLLSTYTYSQIKRMKQTAILTSQLISLYTYLYIVINSNDYALIFGATGLFSVLSTLMYITRKIDWQKLNSENLTAIEDPS